MSVNEYLKPRVMIHLKERGDSKENDRVTIHSYSVSKTVRRQHTTLLSSLLFITFVKEYNSKTVIYRKMTYYIFGHNRRFDGI